jgi:tetratricopeptide (TPR) repeat protein
MSRPFSAAWSLSLATLFVFVVAALDAVAQPTPAQQQQVDALVRQARQRVQTAQWDLAIQHANKALAINPNYAAARVARGMALNAKGEYDKAIEDFDWVTGQKGRDSGAVSARADAYAHRSFSLYKRKKFLEAINSAYFATLERGDHFDAHRFRAMSYLERGAFDKAINSCNRAIRYKEDFAEAYMDRGYAYGAKGNLNQAIADQDKALELKPGLAEAFYRRGAAFATKGDLDKAQSDFDEALRLKPGLVDALCDRALLLVMKRDLPRAIADLDAAIRVDQTCAKAHHGRGRVLLTQGNHDGAIASFNEAIRLQADDARAYYFRAYAYGHKEEFEQAVKNFTKAIELKPDFGIAYNGRAAAYRKLGKRQAALADKAKLRELIRQTANTRKKEEEEEPTDEGPPRFLVQSKAVNPAGLPRALQSAAHIDQLVEANYRKHRVTPTPPTTDEQFLRRIYLDITGTIPTYLQTQRFLNSRDVDKRAKLIDTLLNSDGYASHHFNYWADVLRYTDNLTADVGGESYRQWIKQSLAENKPWDKFVYELLTAEGLIWENAATGYLQRDSGMPLDNMNNTVRIFLGTRIGCAQCHDHPFDKWTQLDFYQMAAFTFGTQMRTGGGDTRYWDHNPNERLRQEYNEIEQEEEDRRRNSYRFNRLIGVNMRIVNDQANRKIRLPNDYAYDNAEPGQIIEPKTLFGGQANIRQGEAPRHAFARWLTSKDNPRFALTIANRLWKRAFGVGQIEPVDDMMDGSTAENPELMAFLESELKRLDFDMKEYLRMIFNTKVYQRQACFDEVNPGEPYHFPGPILRRMTAEQVWDSFLTLAVTGLDEYRELLADVRTDALGVDLSNISAEDLLEVERKVREIDGQRGARQRNYTFKGVLLARASELPSPLPANHFLRVFGQSNRELISASSKMGSVPQVLFMYNGPITHMLLERNTTIYNNVMRRTTVARGVQVVFRMILSRDPSDEEKEIAIAEIKANGAVGYGNVIWSLVNTREFLFIR